MALDPNIPLQAGQGVQPIDPMRAMSNAYTLKALMQQGEAAAWQQEQSRKAAQRDEAMRGAFVVGADGKIDKQATLRNLTAAGGGQQAAALAHQWQSEDLALKKADSDARTAAITQFQKTREVVGPIFAALGENPSPDQIVQGARHAISMGAMTPDQLPQDPSQLSSWYKQQRMSFLTVSQQLDEQRKNSTFNDPLLNFMAERDRFEKLQRAGAPTVQGGPTVPGATTDINAPTVGVSARDPLDARAAQLAYGNPQAFRYDANGNVVGVPEVQAYEKAKAAASATQVKQFNNAKDDFKNERDLRNDFKSEPIYKAHQEVKVAYGQIDKSLKLKSPAGDLAAATKIMKLLDPTSVVRESELSMAIAATGLEDRITSYVTNIINGTKLTPKQREDFRKLANELYTESDRAFSSKQKEYGDVAAEYGLNPRRVGGAGQKTEFDKMPDAKEFKGRQIRAPNGRVYRSDGIRWNAEAQ